MAISVLLADDHAVVSDGLRCLLEAQQDIRVIGHASNGRDAVRLVMELNPDIVIMDIAMPDFNGVEATAMIGAKSPATKVIMLSMYSDAEHIFRALQAGAKAYVLKASAGKEVTNAVRTVLAGSRYLSPKIAETVIDDYIQERRATSPLDSLSMRERQVLQLFAEGKSITVIAEMLTLSPRTVETYRARLMQKLGIGDLPGLVKFAIQHGITTLT